MLVWDTWPKFKMVSWRNRSEWCIQTSLSDWYRLLGLHAALQHGHTNAKSAVVNACLLNIHSVQAKGLIKHLHPVAEIPILALWGVQHWWTLTSKVTTTTNGKTCVVEPSNGLLPSHAPHIHMPWKEYLQTILDNVFYNIDNTVIILVKKPLDLNSSQREDKKMLGKCLLWRHTYCITPLVRKNEASVRRMIEVRSMY